MYSYTILDYVPMITEQDVTRGYVSRFFITKSNHITTAVHEVSRKEYDRLKGKDIMVSGYINWTIRGKLEDTILSIHTGNPSYEKGYEPITIPGVLTQNRGAVIFLSRKIPAIKSYLRKYDQFYVGE